MPTVKKQSNHVVKKTAGRGVLARIAPVSLGKAALKMNVYGRSGTGKTTFACTFPKPLLIVGAEDGTKSVHNVSGVEFVRLDTSGEVEDIALAQKDGGRWKTIVIDSASSLQDMIMKEILGLEKLPAQRSWGMATRDQWGQCAIQTKELLRALLDLDCNVLVLAQEREFNTETEGELLMPFVGSALTPSVTGWLNPACDYIVQTFIREQSVVKKIKLGTKVVDKTTTTGIKEYCLRTGPDAVYTTKFRLPKGTPLPDVVVDADYSKVLKLIQGG